MLRGIASVSCVQPGKRWCAPSINCWRSPRKQLLGRRRRRNESVGKEEMEQNEKHAHQCSGKAREVMGDFTATTRVLSISALAVCIGPVAAFVAMAFLHLIGLFTILFYFELYTS